MPHAQIIFIGLVLLANVTIGNQIGRRVIIPQVEADEDAGIGHHRAFIAFPDNKGDSKDVVLKNWKKTPLSSKLTEGAQWAWVPLDGDEVTISLHDEPLSLDESYKNAIGIQAHCPEFKFLSNDYAFGTNAEDKAAQIDLGYGKLFTQPMFTGMKASRLQTATDGTLTITAFSWRTGKKRSLTIKVHDNIKLGDVWIGNMRDEFFSPGADPNHDGAAATNMHDYLAYYKMDSTLNGCYWEPADYSTKGFGVGCSNTNFP